MELAAGMQIPFCMAKILINRGIYTVPQADSFLNPKLADLVSPDSLPDIDRAAERVRQAAMSNQKVVIYGDYDVDGTTATALLVQFLRLLNMDVSYYVPHRIREGYGLSTSAIQRFSKDEVELLITVDCGINAIEEIKQARARGIDVIVTDHHEPGAVIPDAFAIINPKLPGSKYPFKHLSGVGVAFKLAWAVAQRLSPGSRVTPEFREFLMDAIGLVALGTIADVVPLIGENRVLAKFGLEALRASRSPGVRALIESVGLDRRPIESHHVSFLLAPRLNAAGRMAEASLCVELFTTDSTDHARGIAEQLDKNNRFRQQIQGQVLESVRRKIDKEIDLDHDHVLVLADQLWHAGVLGIVASKIVDDYHRPTLLVSLDEDDEGRGSGRSIPQFNLFDALTECRKELISFGGHSQAAGIKIRNSQLDNFRQALNVYAAEKLHIDELVEQVYVDTEIELPELTLELVRTIDKLAPYGEGNRPPLFCARDVRLVGVPRLMGKEDRHLAFYVRQGNASFRALAFGQAYLYEQTVKNDRCDLAFKTRISEWNGTTSVELDVVDMKFRE